MTFSLIMEHMFLVLAAITMSILIGIPLGVCAYMMPKSRGLILKVVDILQTIPALALLGLIMILAGPGKLTVVIGITLYSLLPIVQNTCLGLSGIDPGVEEAAKGVGMTDGEGRDTDDNRSGDPLKRCGRIHPGPAVDRKSVV